LKLTFSGNKSRAIIWLHGFCISSEIWKECIPSFNEDYCSVQIDLPGFGDSPLVYFESLSDLAEQVYQTIKSQNIPNATMIGHSLGGYICMEIARKYPDFCNSLILFHSNAFEDSEDRKAIRQVYLDAYERFGTEFFLKNFHENLFYQKRPELIEPLKEKHADISVETLQRYTAAMKARKGYDDILTNHKPKMIISGAFDKAISSEEYLKMYNKAENCELLILSNSAHMGMMEESEKATNAILSFLKMNDQL